MKIKRRPVNIYLIHQFLNCNFLDAQDLPEAVLWFFVLFCLLFLPLTFPPVLYFTFYSNSIKRPDISVMSFRLLPLAWVNAYCFSQPSQLA